MTKYIESGEHNYDVKATFVINGAQNSVTGEKVDITGEFSYKGQAIPE